LSLRAFLSYSFQDEGFVARISHLLKKQSGIEPFFYAHEKRTGNWDNFLTENIKVCDVFVYIAGAQPGHTQAEEVDWFFRLFQDAHKRTLLVRIPGGSVDHFPKPGKFDPVTVEKGEIRGEILDPAENIARQIFEQVTRSYWTPLDGVPLGYPFAYEKDIIGAYLKDTLDTHFLELGCPPNWPKVFKYLSERPGDYYHLPDETQKEIQTKLGGFGPDSAEVVVDARVGVQGVKSLALPEARPRQLHWYPRPGAMELRVGILVSGGIAPGINAVIDGIVKRHELYQQQTGKRYALSIKGYRDGLMGLAAEGSVREPLTLTSKVVDRQAEMGGSLLTTSRWDAFVEAGPDERDQLLSGILEKLWDIDILYMIGGDGSMRAAHAIWKKAHATKRKRPLSVIGIPKTMDNDILWVWQSFGFPSAVDKAREAALHLHTEAKSNPRLCVLQLFGSDSGFVAAHVGLASGVCDAVLIPEVEYTMEGLFTHLKARLEERYHTNPHALVVMAETAIPLDALDYIKGLKGSEPPDDDLKDLQIELSEREATEIVKFFNHDRRVRGQTPDDLRTGGLKIVKEVLQKMIKRRMSGEYWQHFRVFTSEPRHLIRSVPPSSSEVIFAERLGALAVDNAMAGYSDFMVSQWLTEYVLVPLELAILGRKRVPPDGIFWKSVLASTEQPPDMVRRRPAAFRAAAAADSTLSA